MNVNLEVLCVSQCHCFKGFYEASPRKAPGETLLSLSGWKGLCESLLKKPLLYPKAFLVWFIKLYIGVHAIWSSSMVIPWEAPVGVCMSESVSECACQPVNVRIIVMSFLVSVNGSVSVIMCASVAVSVTEYQCKSALWEIVWVLGVSTVLFSISDYQCECEYASVLL